MLCFALCPGTMWHYPLSLAFWIYACDFCVTLQFVIISAKRLAVGDGAALADPSDPVSALRPASAFSSAPECLCALGEVLGQQFPGCVCSGGWLSFLVQGGLVGSVCFYMALAHNFCALPNVSIPLSTPLSRDGALSGWRRRRPC